MNIQPLLALIRKHESRGDYNVVWGGIRATHRPKKPLVKMTIAEVLAWQDSIDPLYMSEAAGAYQILEDTLRGLYKRAGLTADTLFSASTQDKLAVRLLEGRGLTQYLEGKISTDTFCNNVAKEWASMPVVTQTTRGKTPIRPGQSYYAGDGLNKASCSVADLRDAVLAIKARVDPPITAAKPISPAAPVVPVKPIAPAPGFFGKGGAKAALLPTPTASLTETSMFGSSIQTEIGRIARHSLTPIVAAAVAGGWLPAAAQGPIIELGMIGASFVASLLWSRAVKR